MAFPDTDTITEILQEVKIRKAQAAQITGRDESAIRSIKFQLDVLRTQGLLIDLNIRGTSMFTRTASWIERGVIDEQEMDRFTKGQKHLIPAETVKKLKSVEARMRQLLDKLCIYNVTGFYPFRWLPYTAYEKFRDEWDRLCEEFDEIKVEIIANYDQYISELETAWREIAQSAWLKILAQGYEGVEIEGVTFDAGTPTEADEKFVQFLIDAAREKMPTIQDIETGLIADYATALVYGEKEAAAERAQVEVLKAQAHAESEKAYLHNSILQEQARHERAMYQYAEQAKADKIAAMREAEAEHARQRLKEVASPFEEVFTALRRQMAQDAQAMLESIQKNGFVRGKVAEKGAGLIEMFNLLAVHNDYELRARLIELKKSIGPVGFRRDDHERDLAEIETILSEIVDLEKSAVDDLLSGPDRFSMVEI